MKKFYTLTFILWTTLSFGQAPPIGLIGVNTPYFEDFTGLGPSDTAFIPGWTAINTIDSSTLTMSVSDGSSATGNAYNVGATGSEDRAFGILADATTIPALVAVFQNNTGSTVTKITIQARMEQWRASGNNGVNEKVAFSYSLDATNPNNGTWTPVTALDLNEKLTSSSTAVAVNGNLSPNYSNLASIISGLNWLNGTTLWIKWVDTNEAGANGLFAIENFYLSVGEVLGIKQNAISGLNMYPNPVKDGNLFITSNSDEAKSVAVYDTLGKQVLNAKTSNKAVNVSALKSGSYIVKITEEGKTDTKKLIIE